MTDPTPIETAWPRGAVTVAVHRSEACGNTVHTIGSAGVAADPASGEAAGVASCWRAWVQRRIPPSGAAAVARRVEAVQSRRHGARDDGPRRRVRCGPVELLFRPGEVAAWMDRQIRELVDPRTVVVDGRARVAMFDPQARIRLWHAHQLLAEQGHMLSTTVPGMDAQYEVIAEPVPDGQPDRAG